MTHKSTAGKSTAGLASEIGTLLNNHLVDDLKEALSAIKNMQLLLSKFDEDADLDTAALASSSASLADFALLTLSCLETNIQDLMKRGVSNAH